MKRKVVIGFAGIQLDGGKGPDRWNKWRPSVSITQRDDIEVDRFDLLFNGNQEPLVGRIAADMSLTSPSTEVRSHRLPILDAWDFQDVYSALLAFAKAYEFNIQDEEYWIHMTTGSHVVQICMFLLTKSGYFPGVLLQTSPPKRAGDVGGFDLIDLDLSKYDKLDELFHAERQQDTDFLKFGLVTRNKRYNEMISEIERVILRSRKPVLLTGKSGTGKTSLARRIYVLKKERGQVVGKLVEVNCATLVKDTASSTLFGHKKGGFTGANADRDGLLLAADRGILFLDEIADLGLDEQAMLLKALEDKSFYPFGSDVSVSSDFQLIAGTNKDINAEVVAGRFRDDLFARINTWSFSLPSLVDRSEDMEPSIDYLLSRYCEENSCVVRFSSESKSRFLAFAVSDRSLWPGNFRDLTSSIERMATLSINGRIDDDIVNREIQRLSGKNVEGGTGWGVDSGLALPLSVGEVDLFDECQLRMVVDVCKTSRSLSDAGRKIFAVSRASKSTPNDADRLKKYLAKFGLSWASICE